MHTEKSARKQTQHITERIKWLPQLIPHSAYYRLTNEKILFYRVDYIKVLQSVLGIIQLLLQIFISILLVDKDLPCML